jgi:hypothetical protein
MLLPGVMHWLPGRATAYTPLAGGSVCSRSFSGSKLLRLRRRSLGAPPSPRSSFLRLGWVRTSEESIFSR